MARSNAAVTDDEMNMLSDEERAALADGDKAAGSAAGDLGATEVIPDDKPAAATTPGGDDDDDDEAPAGDAPADETPADETPADETPAASIGEREEPFVPTYRAEPVENYAEKIAAIDKQFEDGELTMAEYNRQRDALVRQQTKAEIADDQNEQLSRQRWQWEVKHFIKDISRNEGIDYNRPLLNAALDTAVKALAAETDAAGNLINVNKEGDWFLQEAHKRVKEELGLGRKPEAPDNTPPKPAKGAGPRLVPTTLAQVPAAELPDTGAADPFANIDKMFEAGRTEEAEMELAKLSKADQLKYLRG